MTNRQITALIALVLLFFVSLPFLVAGLAQSAAPDLTGVYVVDGRNPDGKAYQGTAEISQQGDTYALHWQLEPQGEARGIGIFHGAALAVIYQLDSGALGLAAYHVERQENQLRLIGQWTAPGSGRLFTEVLTKTALRDPALLRGPRVGV